MAESTLTLWTNRDIFIEKWCLHRSEVCFYYGVDKTVDKK